MPHTNMLSNSDSSEKELEEPKPLTKQDQGEPNKVQQHQKPSCLGLQLRPCLWPLK